MFRSYDPSPYLHRHGEASHRRRRSGRGRRRLIAVAVGALAVVAIAATGAAAAGGRSGNYAGFTKSGWPVALRVAPNGRRIAKVAIGLDMTCQSGGGYGAYDSYVSVAIKPSGAFKSSYSDFLVDEGQGHVAALSGQISGTFNRTRTAVSGRLQMHDTERDGQGNPTDQCDSGSVAFSASR